MSKLRQVIKHSSYFAIGRGCLIVLGFISFPLFTRILSVEQYGLMSLAATMILAVTTFSKLGMQHALKRFHSELAVSGSGFRRYYSTLFCGALASTFPITIAYVVCLVLLPGYLISDALRSLLLVASVLIAVRAIQSMISNLLLVEGRTFALNALEVATKALTIAAVCFLLLNWQRTARSYMVGMAIAELAVLASTLPYVLKRGLVSFREFDPVFWREAFVFAYPMIAAELGAIVLDTGDRLLVQHYLGAIALGYYAAAYGLAQYTFELMVIPIGTVFFPICMESWIEKGADETRLLLSNSLRYFLVPAMWMLCLVVLGSRDAIVILASPKFLAAHTLLPVLVLGMFAAAIPIFFRAGLLIKKQSGYIAVISAVAVVSNVAMNIVLLPRVGLQGAALATLGSYVLQAVLTARFSLRALHFEVPYRAAFMYLCCAGLTAIIGLQVKARNPFLELTARIGVALLYPILVLALDGSLRTGLRNLWRRKREPSVVAVG